VAWRGTVLIIGDLIVLTLFSMLGRGSHGLTLGVVDIARTGLPFAAAWLVVNLVSGGFRSRPEPPSPGATALQVIARYAVAGPLALVGRSLWLDRPIPASFAAVALSTSLTLLVAWRVLLAWWCTRAATGGARRPEGVR